MKRTILIYLLLFIMFSISAQRIELISGDPALFKQANAYYLTFEYTDLKVGNYGDEQAYIDYMKDDAEKRKSGSSESWLKKWNDDRVDFYQPKFIELFNINLNYKNVKGDTLLNNQQYEVNLHTNFIEPGFNRNAKRSPALIDVMVTISKISDTGKKLVISMTGVPGVEVMGSYYPDHRRIAEAYAKCGKELAKYLSKVVY